ncbi:hypothetical protein OUZ56_024402 [Daphnia magna]|uniref:Uncharacterized protein n=1 Tax=Daphnia magna TaxID=35525 RepID=A0ABR0B0R9_9CRUS|nr:hypothetical protein OUZ56_024402 [Daphnia magna]
MAALTRQCSLSLSLQSIASTLETETQLQNLLERKEENNAAVETEGQEIINKLEAQQLQEKKKNLEDKLDKNLTEKSNLRQNLLDFSSTNKNLEKEIQELQERVRTQEDQIHFLEKRVKKYQKLQVQFIENEDCKDSRLAGDESGEKSKLVSDKNQLTLPTDSGEKSLHYELEVEQTNDFEQTVDDLKNQIELLNQTIIYPQQENQQIRKKVNMGVTHNDEDTTKNTTQKMSTNISKKTQGR